MKDHHGAYVDEQGLLHIDLAAILRIRGYAATEANQETLRRSAAKLLRELNPKIEMYEVDHRKPDPRPELLDGEGRRVAPQN